MTEAGWTSEKPTAAGWYWHKSGTVVTLVRLIQRNGALLLWVPDNEPRSSAATFDPYPGVEWLGPITPDSYQQGRVASLVAMKGQCTVSQSIVSMLKVNLGCGLVRSISSRQTP